MRKPNPDPHPERADLMQDISPERIIWKQMDRYLESEWFHDEAGIHGAISGLSACLSTLKDEKFEGKTKTIRDTISGFEERNLALFEEMVRILDAKGKWLKEGPRDVKEGFEWRESFQ